MEDIERRLLAILQQEDRLLDTHELVVRLFSPDPGSREAQLATVRRALISLARQGFVCGLRGFRKGWRHWAVPRILLQIEKERPALPMAAHLKYGSEAYQNAKRTQTGKPAD